MKRLLKRAFAWAGYDVRKRPASLIANPAVELKFDLSFVFAHVLLHQADPFVVQVGAYDGRSNDPVFSYIDRFNLGGLLIEPQPEPFRRLASAYAGRPKVNVCQAAVSDRDGTRDLYRITAAGAEMPEWAEQVASFRKEVLLSHAHAIPNVEQMIVTETVPCCTFDTLFHDHAVTRVDVLQIDTEGYDYEVLKLFPFGRFQPAIVHYEHYHLSPADQDACLRFLAGKGYLLWVPDRSGMDTIAYRPIQPRAGAHTS